MCVIKNSLFEESHFVDNLEENREEEPSLQGIHRSFKLVLSIVVHSLQIFN